MYVDNCLQDRQSYTELPQKTGIRMGSAAQLVKRAQSALSKSSSLGNFQTIYWPYFLYDSRASLLNGLTSFSSRNSPRSQWKSLQAVERPVKTKTKVEKAAWERSEAVRHPMRLLICQFLSHLYAPFASSSLYNLDDVKLLK